MSEPEIRLASPAAGRSSALASMSPLAAEFVALFRGQPTAIAQMLAEHVDDGSGHCRTCTAGPQAGRQVYPCWLRCVAEKASTLTLGGSR